jgi:DNA-binding HxlR family transcriptional regulator
MNPDPPWPTLPEALDALGNDHEGAQRQRHADNLAVLLHNMQTFGNRRDAPVRTVPACLGDRWSSLVMHLLSGGMLRHSELRRLITVVSAEHDISQRMLTLKLRVMERDGLIERRVTSDVPPRTEYRLTTLGSQAYAHFTVLVRWAEQASAAIRTARMAYDRQHPESAQLLSDSVSSEGL